MERNFEILRQTFMSGKSLGHKFYAVQVTLPGCNEPEVIINPITNVDNKLQYYGEKYTWDLYMTLFPIIKIVGFATGNSFEEIQNNLEIGGNLNG